MPCRFARVVVVFAIVLSLVQSPTAFAAEKPKAKDKAAAAKTEPAKPSEKQDEMMEAMMKMAAPGPMHDLLKPMTGNFKVTTKSWMRPGVAEPTVTEGTSENTWVLGNRYLQTTFKGNFLGMPFEGYGLLGYDNQKKEFVSVWADNMSTAISFSDGSADPSGKVFTMKSTMTDPATGTEVPYTMTTKVMDENQYTMTMTSMKDGKEHTDMEMMYTRMK